MSTSNGMSRNSHEHDDRDAAIPADLADVAGGLDALGAADRAAAPAGFESRVAQASGAALGAGRGLRLTSAEAVVARQVVVTMQRDSRRRLALAAGVLLAATAGLVLIGVLNRGSGSAAMPGGNGTAILASNNSAKGAGAISGGASSNDNDVDSVLLTIASLDDLGGRSQLDLLLSDTERLAEPLRVDMLPDATENTGG